MLASSCPPAGALLREFYKVFGMPGEGPLDDLDLAVFESMFPVEEGDRYDLQRSLGDDGLRRIHRECSETLDSLRDSDVRRRPFGGAFGGPSPHKRSIRPLDGW